MGLRWVKPRIYGWFFGVGLGFSSFSGSKNLYLKEVMP